MENTYPLPPGPKGLPLFGNVFQLGRDQLRFLLDVQRRYGRMATIHIGRTPVVLLFQPEHVRYILTENPRNFTNREVVGGLVFSKMLLFALLASTFSKKASEDLYQLIGDGLGTTDGAYHDRQRRLVQPSFSKQRVESYAAMIVQYTQEMMERWQPGMEMEMESEIQALVLRMIAKLLLNIDVLKEETNLAEIINGMTSNPISGIEGLLNLPIDLPFTPFGKRMVAMRKYDEFVYSLIERRLAEKQDVGDVLSILLWAKGENSHKMTSKEVRDVLLSLISAGHETTTHTLTWTMYLLSEHPEVFEKLQAELQTVLGGHAPELSDLPQLVYLDQVIKESMRLYPSAWTQGRCAVKDFELDSYRFPAGTFFMFSQWVLHRHPGLWEDADAFRPERWDPAQSRKAPQWAYFPFGGGSRICVGKPLAQLELVLVLPLILQRYFPRVLPSCVVEPLPLITLRSKYGMSVRLEPVKDSISKVSEKTETQKEMMQCPVVHDRTDSSQRRDRKDHSNWEHGS